MPVHPVKNPAGKTIGYQYGKTGKIYRTKAEADKQAKAIYASGYKEKNK
jgi:hypothetical protein